MGKFNVGDRVVAIVDSPADNKSIHAGDAGTVCRKQDGDGWLGVCWDNPVEDGHECGGSCEHGHGWMVPEPELDFEPDDTEPPFQFNEYEFNNLFS